MPLRDSKDNVEKGNMDPTVLAAGDDLTGTTIGRFQITALLGKGGMGEVYLAEDSLLKRPVALKRMSAALRFDPHYRERLIKEAERASQLNDEHVAHINDVVEDKGEIFLVMEYVEGKSLRNRSDLPIPLPEFLTIAEQCVEALVAAHQSGIMHRDLKPENIMVTGKGRVKVCDFGLAQHGAWMEDTSLVGTPTTVFRGTPAYMAPEALLNRNPDFRADMFSLGIVFYELLTGRHPFREDQNQMATADRIIHSAPVAIAQIDASVPQELIQIIDKMMSKDPSDRYASPTEILKDLQAIRLPESRSQVSRRPRFNAAAIVVIVLSAAAFFLLWSNRTWVAVKTGPERTLVVLPFRAIGGNSEAQFFSDGLTETLTARLGHLRNAPSLQITPASEVRTKKVSNVAEALKQFAADIVLDGTLQQSGKNIRLTYSLYDAKTLRQIRGDTIAGSIDDPFALEDRALTDVLTALNISAPVSQPNRSKFGTSVPAAYGLFIQGQGYLQNSTVEEHLQTAMQSFHRAADLDPSYAGAYAALGRTYWAKYESTKEPVWIELARQACEKAHGLDAKSPEANVCLGDVNFGTGQYERAAGDFTSALDLDPFTDSAYMGLANAYHRLGNHDAAERTLRHAIELKPNSYIGYMRLGQFYLGQTRYREAAEQFQREIVLIPDSEQGYIAVGAAYLYLGRYEDAITVFRKSIELRPTSGALSNLGSTYLRLRRFDDAIPVFEAAVKLFPRQFVFAGNLSRAYYWSGSQRSKASAEYEHAIALAGDDLQINPRNSDAHIMLGRYYAMLGKKSEALNHLANALTLRPTEAEYFSIAAVIHNILGDRSAALAALKKAVSLGWSAAEIKSEIEFDNLRMDPEFKKITEG